MTYDAERFLLQEMERDDLIEMQDFGKWKDVLDTTMGFDEEYNVVDEDAGMLFPQEIKEVNLE